MHGIDESNMIERNSICPWLERVNFDVMGVDERAASGHDKLRLRPQGRGKTHLIHVPFASSGRCRSLKKMLQQR